MSLENEDKGFVNKNQSKISSVSQLEGDKNDGAILGQSLIKFMSLATGSVKTALQKPANYKKNINHRRYLQKQLKICTRRKKRSTKTKTGPKTKKGENLGTASEVWFGNANYGGVYMTTGANQDFSSYSNNIVPPSYETSFHGIQANDYHFQNFSTLPNDANIQNGWNNFTFTGREETNVLVEQVNNNNAIFRDDTLPDLVDTDFMTGEELTQSLDIKDLFVPGREQVDNESYEGLKYSCTFDENMHNGFQTVPSTASILSW